MHNDSKLIAEAYFKKLNEGMSVRPAPVAPSQQPPREEDEENNLNITNKKLQKFELVDEQGFEEPEIIEAASYQEALEKALELLGKLVQPYNVNDEEEENNYERDRTDQDRNDKSYIDYAREDKAAAERDKWTQGQGVGGKFQF